MLHATEWYDYDDYWCVDFNHRSGLADEDVETLTEWLTEMGVSEQDILDGIFHWGIMVRRQEDALLTYLKFR